MIRRSPRQWIRIFLASFILAATASVAVRAEEPFGAAWIRDAPPVPEGFPSEAAAMAAFQAGKLKPVLPPLAMPPDVKETRNIVYGKGGGRDMLLHLYEPASGEGLRPGMILIHGGGWSGGKPDDMKFYAVRWAQKGYVVANISYRLKKEAPFPAAVQDAKCAVRWLRAHAETYRVDPNRIVAAGNSAGGHLSMMLGYSAGVPELEGGGGHAGVSSAVQAVINFYGPTDLTVQFARINDTVTSFLQTTWAENPHAFELASPMYHLDPKDPPTCTFHGTVDSIVPVAQAEALDVKLKELGVPHVLDIVPGWPHAMDVVKDINEHCMYVADRFLAKVFGVPTIADETAAAASN